MDDIAVVKDLLGKPDYKTALNRLLAYVDGLFRDAQVNDHDGVYFEHGRRYTKVFAYQGNRRSLWCFVDENGDILLPASWRAPAKHARGNIYDPSSWKNFEWTGPQYLR